ncbi:hypothetical protein, partial [Hymenobacter agri]
MPAVFMPVRPSSATASRPPRRLLGLLLLVAGGLFAGMLVAVLHHGGPSWDVPILEFWHRHATPALDRLAVLLTIVGNTGPMIGLGVLLWLALLVRRQWRAAWTWFASVGGSMLLTQVIKPLVA